jgi:hypothetical protein
MTPLYCDEHKWRFQHVVYWNVKNAQGQSIRTYGDRFYCTRCRKTVVDNERVSGSAYDEPLPHTYPR